MFTSTFLKVSRISLSTSSIFLLGIALRGNGRGIGGCYRSELGLEEGPSICNFRLPTGCSDAGTEAGTDEGRGTVVVMSICFPDLNVMCRELV